MEEFCLELQEQLPQNSTFFIANSTMFGVVETRKIWSEFHWNRSHNSDCRNFSFFLFSILAIKFLMGYIKKHDFKVFGWYRIALGIVVLLFFSLFR